MKTKRSWSIGAWALRLALVLVVATGCHSCTHLAGFAGITAGHSKSAKAPAGGHYLAIRATKNGASAQVQPSRELVKPFRLEGTLGLFDDKHADLGTDGSFGITVLQAGGLGARYVITVKRLDAGIVVEAGLGGAPIGTLAIPDALSADVSFSTSGNILSMSARKQDDPNYTELATAYIGAFGPYVAELEVSELPKGAVVGYARARLPENGVRVNPTATQTARETIYTATDAVAEAMYAIDAAAPDRTRAGDQLDLAVARFDAAILMDLTEFPGAAKKLKSVRKKTAALATAARGKKSAAAVVKSAVGILTAAGAVVNPEN